MSEMIRCINKETNKVINVRKESVLDGTAKLQGFEPMDPQEKPLDIEQENSNQK